MNTNFINRKDRIVASAVEIISESGLSSLTTKTLAMKENMSESLLYRYFGGIDEVLVEVVETFAKFDHAMIATVEAKEIPHCEKVLELLRVLGTYYEGYYEMAAIVLNYEEFLHNINTRDIIANSIHMRTSFIRKELKAAIAEGELKDTFTSEELTDILLGFSMRDLLNRRIESRKRSLLEAGMTTSEKIIGMLRIE